MCTEPKVPGTQQGMVRYHLERAMGLLPNFLLVDLCSKATGPLDLLAGQVRHSQPASPWGAWACQTAAQQEET